MEYHITQNNVKSPIPTATQEKDLGIIFDTEMKLKHHISNCINKGNRIVGLLKRTFAFLDKRSLSKLYKSLVRPHLEYGNVIWCPRYKKDINAIESIQRRATKLLPELKNLPYHERLNHLKLPTPSFRRHRGDVIQVFKLLNGMEDINYNTFFELSEVSYTRGHRLKLKKQNASKDIRKHFFSQRIINPWNSLPENMITAATINQFKNRFYKYMGQPMYTYEPDLHSVQTRGGIISFSFQPLH